MATLSTGAITRLRRFVARGRTARCAVQNPDEVTYGPGGQPQPQTYTTVTGQDALPCACRPAATPAEIVTADQERAVESYELEFDPGTIVDAKQRVVVTYPGTTAPSMTVAVTGPQLDMPDAEIARVVLATRVVPPEVAAP